MANVVKKSPMRKIIKAILPRPVLNKVIQFSDWLLFVTIPQEDFDPANLCSSAALSLPDIYENSDIAAAWDNDNEVIARIYGDNDNIGGVNPGDRRALYYLIMALKPKNVLEIGTHIGASTLHIASALKQLNNNGKVTSADIIDVNHPQSGPWKQLGMAKSPKDFATELGCHDHIDFHVGPCLDFMSKTKHRYDFIFLDGDHTAKAVYKEVSTALSLLNKNGVILLHDFYPDAKPLFPDNFVLRGPFTALESIKKQSPAIDVLPLGNLPWPTKLGTNITSLALVVNR
jgi:predicted O-methyltransferase YrrM